MCPRSPPSVAAGEQEKAAEHPEASAAQALPASPRKNLLMVYTCGKCEQRSVMAMSKQSYENGCVARRDDGSSSYVSVHVALLIPALHQLISA